MLDYSQHLSVSIGIKAGYFELRSRINDECDNISTSLQNVFEKQNRSQSYTVDCLLACQLS